MPLVTLIIEMKEQKQRDISRQPWPKVYYTPESRISKVVGVISILLAALLLIGANDSLYAVKSPKIRLGLLAVWTFLFALAVSCLSTAQRAELFGASAA